MPRSSDTVVVAESTDAVETEMWVNALRAAGIGAGSYERGVGAALGGAATSGFASFRIVVQRADLGASRSVIAEHGGAASLMPVRERSEINASQRSALVLVGLIVVAVVALAIAAKIASG